MAKRIVRLYKQGWLFSTIAKDTGQSVDDVIEVLVDAGIINEMMIELRKANGR